METHYPDPDFDLAVLVLGSVLDEANEPICGVIVRNSAYPWNGSCGTEMIAPPVQTSIAELGEYDWVVTSDGEEEFDACITLEAIPPEGLDLVGETRSHLRAKIRPLEEGIETLNVHFTLLPIPAS